MLWLDKAFSWWSRVWSCYSMQYVSFREAYGRDKSIIVWLGWLHCALRLMENHYQIMILSSSFSNYQVWRALKLSVELTCNLKKNPQQNPQKVGAVLWFPVVLEKLWGEALSHWCVTAVGSVTNLWYRAAVQQMINMPQQSDPRLWLCDRDAFR